MNKIGNTYVIESDEEITLDELNMACEIFINKYDFVPTVYITERRLLSMTEDIDTSEYEDNIEISEEEESLNLPTILVGELYDFCIMEIEDDKIYIR